MNDIRESTPIAFREGTQPGKREAVLIEAGWGSSGYYSEDVLSRDIPRIFPPGTHMYLDHPTESEGTERPERTVRDLVGTIAETPRMAGISAVAPVNIYPHWEPVIDAMSSDIGLSIRALGTMESGDAGGKHGPVVKTLDEGLSVDYVTQAGAGGRLLPLIESARTTNNELELVDWQTGKVGWTTDDSLVTIAHFLSESLQVKDIELTEGEYDSLIERDISKDERIALAKKGQAIPIKNDNGDIIGGRFPMANCGDVTNASRSIGRGGASNEQLKGFIKRVASKLNCPVPFKESGSGRNSNKEDEAMSGELEQKLSESQNQVRQLTEKHDTVLKEHDDKINTVTKEKDDAIVRAERAEDALVLRDAGAIVAKEVSGVKGLPEKAQSRIAKSVLDQDVPTNSDGKLDESVLVERTHTAIKDEVDYLKGVTSNRVTGLGESQSGNGSEGDSVKDLQKTFEKQGMSESAALAAAEGR